MDEEKCPGLPMHVGPARHCKGCIDKHEDGTIKANYPGGTPAGGAHMEEPLGREGQYAQTSENQRQVDIAAQAQNNPPGAEIPEDKQKPPQGPGKDEKNPSQNKENVRKADDVKKEEPEWAKRAREAKEKADADAEKKKMATIVP